jgi:ribosome modulation factor
MIERYREPDPRRRMVEYWLGRVAFVRHYVEGIASTWHECPYRSPTKSAAWCLGFDERRDDHIDQPGRLEARKAEWWAIYRQHRACGLPPPSLPFGD